MGSNGHHAMMQPQPQPQPQALNDIEHRIAENVQHMLLARFAVQLQEMRDIEHRVDAKLIELQQLANASHGGLMSPSEVSPNKPKKCAICDGTKSVHQHRKLGLPLDDRCRKQVESFVQGSQINDRRAAWISQLSKMQKMQFSNDQKMFAARMLESVQEMERKANSSSKKRKLDLNTPTT